MKQLVLILFLTTVSIASQGSSYGWNKHVSCVGDGLWVHVTLPDAVPGAQVTGGILISNGVGGELSTVITIYNNKLIDIVRDDGFACVLSKQPELPSSCGPVASGNLKTVICQ